MILAVALAVGGCGVATTTGTRVDAASSELRHVQATHELPSHPAAQHAVGSASPARAIRRFARRYVNWDAGDVAARMRSLARSSVGQARSEMALTAARVGADRTLRRAGIANHGTVEAVAPVGRRGWHRYVVVTRERTTATYTAAYQGLAPAWHVTVVTVARVTAGRGAGPRAPRRWVVSVWQPES